MSESVAEIVYRVARAIMIARDGGGCIVNDWVAEARDNPHVGQAVRQALAALAEMPEVEPLKGALQINRSLTARVITSLIATGRRDDLLLADEVHRADAVARKALHGH